jgi:hypothetical protein
MLRKSCCVFGKKGIAFIFESGICVVFPRAFSFTFNPSHGILATTYMSDDRDKRGDSSPFLSCVANEIMYYTMIET